ncbi:TRAP-type mannitol/chloroaromatic compound transport system substrate-binding protein [Constrictibacter sp. MBR-5]|jgi:TRAP-type mannitol/chloroaromatic compound transport system substrate-binding protein|uniref:TRAP transporter substrate-binding protein DctP n=1 Tax=Constrictibacter sp. MBR-5 TaxID=3156467 RepID=UPI003395F99F
MVLFNGVRLAAFGLAGGMAFAASTATAQDVQWELSVWGPPRAYTKSVETLASEVEEKSGGKFKIRVHYAEAISPAKENLDGVKLGAFEAASFCASYHPGKNPAMTGLDLPFLPVAKGLDNVYKLQDTYYQHPIVQKEMQRWNAIAFMPTPLPQYEFMGTGKAPETLEDWKSMRVRALGGLGEAMRELGAVPTSVPAPEIYTSLERGMINAAAAAYTYMHGSYRLYEVSKWYTDGLSPGTINCGLIFNRDAWQALPENYRQMLTEAKPKAYEAMKAAYLEADAKNEPLFEEKGLKRLTYTAEQRAEFEKLAAKPVWERWAAEMKSKNLPGQELLDFILAEARKTGS